MRKIISLFCLLLPIVASADQLQIRENAPDRYVVVKGDTLWDISAKFFNDPWKWPEIWGLNKDTIKDPHWIYPGDVVFLDRATGTLRIGEPASPAPAGTTSEIPVTDNDIEKLSPQARVIPSERDAIPEIPLKVIAPFLARPLVLDDNELAAAPTLIGTYEQRVMLGTDDIAYVEGMPTDKGDVWQVFRPGQTFIDSETEEVLGHEVVYLGDAAVEKRGNISQLRITRSIQEINKGDRFAQAASGYALNYTPHAPSDQITARIISIFGGVRQAGQNAIITLNKGRRDGLENGHVLALYQKGEELKTPGWFEPNKQLPDMRYGLVFVFRVFEKVSYALVMQTRLPVQMEDTARTP